MIGAFSHKPAVCPGPMQEAFEIQARQLGLRPSDPWVGDYVDYEWEHLRHIIAALPVRPEGLKVLEFGCNVGASAILFAHLGAHVTATDIAPDWVTLARLNAQRYGLNNIAFSHVPDSRSLGFANGSFDMIVCNSVLEYVDHSEIAAVQREIDRVLAPGGLIMLSGSSNRLWPREAHSGRWLVNYLPRGVDRLFGASLQRGMWPWTARYGFGPHYDNLDSAGAAGFFARSRSAMGMRRRRLAPLLWTARVLGTGPGLLAPNLSCLLRKRGA